MVPFSLGLFASLFGLPTQNLRGADLISLLETLSDAQSQIAHIREDFEPEAGLSQSVTLTLVPEAEGSFGTEFESQSTSGDSTGSNSETNIGLDSRLVLLERGAPPQLPEAPVVSTAPPAPEVKLSSLLGDPEPFFWGKITQDIAASYEVEQTTAGFAPTAASTADKGVTRAPRTIDDRTDGNADIEWLIDDEDLTINATAQPNLVVALPTLPVEISTDPEPVQPIEAPEPAPEDPEETAAPVPDNGSSGPVDGEIVTEVANTETSSNTSGLTVSNTQGTQGSGSSGTQTQTQTTTQTTQTAPTSVGLDLSFISNPVNTGPVDPAPAALDSGPTGNSAAPQSAPTSTSTATSASASASASAASSASSTTVEASNDAPAQSGKYIQIDTASGELSENVFSGRVSTLEIDATGVESIEVLQAPDYGTLTVNPDMTLALVLTGEEQTDPLSFQIKVTYASGQSETVSVDADVTAPTQAAGWGTGDFYMLETDADNNLVVEHGENHRKIHISGHEDALSRADIAALEGLQEHQINQRFFDANPEYGGSPDMALDQEAGQLAWRAITGKGVEDGSHWLLLERGYSYDSIGRIFDTATKGESALNPIYFGAYGTGEDPVVDDHFKLLKKGHENIVIQGLDFHDGVTILRGDNIVLDDISVRDEELNIQNVVGFTLRGADVTDVTTDAASNGTEWSPHADRASGIYAAKVDGLLIENSFFDHNGWEQGYDPNLSAAAGQAPSKYSHNVYLQSSNRDVTFRDNIVMQGSATGAQIRSGGFVEDNAFIDNNGALLVASGGSSLAGNFSLVNDNIVTSGAHKQVSNGQGSLTSGITVNGSMASLVDNMVVHLADPNNAAEQDSKAVTHNPLSIREGDEVFDNTVIHNWVGSKNFTTALRNDVNTADLGVNDVLDEVTIQKFAAELLGQNSATIQDLAGYIRAQAEDGSLNDVVDADLIVAFFQEGFGVDVVLRDQGETLRFVPNDLGDGVRWDNRLNWTSESLPGVEPTDDVSLAGNMVIYGGSTTINDLDFGEGGHLIVNHGFLEATGMVTTGDQGATLEVDNAGQIWLDGYTDHDSFVLRLDGGRLGNSGLWTGTTDMEISDDAQVILATGDGDFALNSDSRLHITGGDAKVGFDSADSAPAVLLLGKDAQIGFTADAETGLGTIREFYSGRFESDGLTIQSGINLGDSDLFLDIASLDPGTAYNHTLMRADELIGSFDDVNVTGLSGSQDLTITVDYTLDAVMLSLGAGSGNATINYIGQEDDAQAAAALWSALNNGHGLYAGDPVSGIPDDPDL